MKQDITFKEAFDELLNAVIPNHPTTIEAEKAFGLVTAQDIFAFRDVPGFDNSAMDGWAINTTDKQPYKISETSFAGHSFEGTIPKNGCVKITTGAKIPLNCDAVIPIENSKIESGIVHTDSIPRKWDNIRKFNNDIKRGSLLIQKGKILTAADIANLFVQGIAKINIYPKPKISFFTTGDEIVDSFQKEDSVVNSNQIFLRHKFREWNIDADFAGNASDSIDSLKSKISQDANIIISTGGVSMGEKDLVKSALEQSGWKVIFWKVKMKPGKPLLFAKKGETLFLGLPGNPVSVAVLTEVFVKPIILKMSGIDKDNSHPQYQTGILKHDLKTKSERTTFLIGKYFYDKERYEIEAFEDQSSQRLSLLSLGNAIIHCSPNASFSKGDLLNFIPIQ